MPEKLVFWIILLIFAFVRGSGETPNPSSDADNSPTLDEKFSDQHNSSETQEYFLLNETEIKQQHNDGIPDFRNDTEIIEKVDNMVSESSENLNQSHYEAFIEHPEESSLLDILLLENEKDGIKEENNQLDVSYSNNTKEDGYFTESMALNERTSVSSVLDRSDTESTDPTSDSVSLWSDNFSVQPEEIIHQRTILPMSTNMPVQMVVTDAELLDPAETQTTQTSHSIPFTEMISEPTKDTLYMLQTNSNVSTNNQRKKFTAPRDYCYERPVIELCHTLPYEKRLEISKDGTHGAWYYDAVEMGCQFTSDCILNDNNFKSKEDCEKTCIPLSGPSRCLAPPKAGYFHCSKKNPTRAIVPLLMIFFDKTTGKCRWFTYYGCGGSANRFHSIAECEATCNEKVASQIFLVSSALCRIPPSTEKQRIWPALDYTSSSTENDTSGLNNILFDNLTADDARVIEPSCANIGQAESRWYLDIETGTCKEFAYSHCGGSANNFMTQTDCEQFCGAKKETAEEICLQNVSRGECNEEKQMWYFDSHFVVRKELGEQITKGECRAFNYSGCGGNSNRFSDRATCEHVCKHLRIEVGFTEPPQPIDNLSLTIIDTIEGETLNLMEANSKQLNATLVTQTQVGTRTNMTRDNTLELLNIDFEPCRRPPVVGQCRPLNCSTYQANNNGCISLSFQRWFFNAHTSNCEPFQYSGCGGSENTFDDAQSCQEACKSRIVRPDRDRRCDSLPHHTKCYTLSLGHAPGLASNSTIAFHFSLESATCKAFYLDASRPGCDLISYFSNGHECLQACVRSTPTEKHLQNRCFARKTHATWSCGSEYDKTFRWSYISELNQCVQFSQCMSKTNSSDQPGNNFASRSMCEATCMASSFEEVCQLQAERGPCHGTQARYFYDIKSGRCRMFLYGGCLGNANRFLSRQECERACGKFASYVLNNTESLTIESSLDKSSNSSENDLAPLVPAEVFDQMRRITQRHTDHFPWDMCLESHWYGTCPITSGYHVVSGGFPFTQLTRYFYDRRLGKCQPFTYTGCGARANHFDTAKGCKEVCEDRLRNPKSARCREVNRTKLCSGSGIHGWVFNHSIGDCHSVEVCPTGMVFDSSDFSSNAWNSLRKRRTGHWLGIFQAATGQLPLGIYATRGACQFHCLPKPPRGTDAQNVCHMNPIVTVPFGCNAMVTRWYFEPREATCRSYITCPQYGNNFPSEQACRSICAPTQPLDVCRLPLDHGGCSQFQTRWHYDMNKRACVQFTYGGCFGNSNRFLSRAECESFCTAQDVCRLPLQRNSTDPTYPKRYFFDQAARMCKPFYFTGILAHGNNFQTLEDCNAVCLFVPELDVIGGALISEELSLVERQELGVEEIKSKGSSVKDVILAPSDSRATDIFVTGHKSLCIVSLADIGANELFEQTICEPEDIIHELGHRFRPVPKQNAQGQEVDGVCEQTLVPICLSEPRRVFGTIVDPMMQTIGRVFRSQAECEEICLSTRRVRRSVHPPLTDEVNLEKAIAGLLGNEIFIPENQPNRIIRNGCSPKQSLAEQVDQLQHNLQAFTRWPCKFDTPEARALIPFIEGFAGTEAQLTCWVVSRGRPTSRWVHFKDRKTYSVAPVKIPGLRNVWQAHLRIPQVVPAKHNGAWSCIVRGHNNKEQLEVPIVLHVVSQHIIQNTLLMQNSAMDHTRKYKVDVPEGGTLLLGCQAKLNTVFGTSDYSPRVTWHHIRDNGRNDSINSAISLNNVSLLHIKSVNASQHEGTWCCQIKHQQPAVKFYVEIQRPPRFGSINSIQNVYDIHYETVQKLNCSDTDFGRPVGQLTWYQRAPGKNRKLIPSFESSLIVYASPGEIYTCRIENLWGFVERNFYFRNLL